MRDATQMLGFTGPSGVVRVAEPSKSALDAFLDAYQARPTFTGFPNRRGDDGLPARGVVDELGTTVKMYVNEDRWVGDCPFCNSGIAGVYRLDECICLDCGRRMGVSWPSSTHVEQAQVVLERRPEPNRNWIPDRESVDDLKVENMTRGIPIT
jgi:hypothetical protein